MSGVGAESRPLEARIVGGFLDSAASEPSALLIEGEPGIGKTTLWLAAQELARDRGFRVLSARAAAAESVLAYTAACRPAGRGTGSGLGGPARTSAIRG